MNLPVYLDNHATTRVDPRVVDAMIPWFSDRYGNAASRQHEFGWVAEAGVSLAREHVANLIDAHPAEITFTSGATESINLAIKGAAEANRSRGNHIITATTEHRAGLDTCRRLEEYGFAVTYLPVDPAGRFTAEHVESALTDKTILVSLMFANNEIGTLAPIEEIGLVCRARRVLFHTDATQAVGRVPVCLRSLQVDMMSFSAHKMYGPKGVGALYVRGRKPAIALASQIDGGGHEHGLRSGTLNVPAIVGFGEAARITREEIARESERVATLRDRLVLGIRAGLGAVRVNGDPENKLPNNASITFPGANADRMMMAMTDIAVSSGSACSSASPEPSHVLRAIGLSESDARSTLRFGLGRFTTEDEIDYAVRRIIHVANDGREHTEAVEATHAHSLH